MSMFVLDLIVLESPDYEQSVTDCANRANMSGPDTGRMAVRVGFEPTEPVKVQRFSRPPDSTALAPHRFRYLTISECGAIDKRISWERMRPQA